MAAYLGDKRDIMRLEESLLTYCLTHHYTLSVAESCTGGAIAARLTKIPRASEYFAGGIVSYTIPVKEQLLDVSHELIQQFGVVSEPVAIAMAKGMRARLNTDYAFSTTGVAGPSGGTTDCPVGSVYVGFADKTGRAVATYLRLSGDREQVIDMAVEQALTGLMDFMMDIHNA